MTENTKKKIFNWAKENKKQIYLTLVLLFMFVFPYLYPDFRFGNAIVEQTITLIFLPFTFITLFAFIFPTWIFVGILSSNDISVDWVMRECVSDFLCGPSKIMTIILVIIWLVPLYHFSGFILDIYKKIKKKK